MTRPSFNFRLERVRALRERVEDHAREELASSLSLRMKGQAMLLSASETVSQAEDARRQSAEVGASGRDLVAGQAYLERAQRAREAAALELDRHDAEVDARRVALQQAARDREVLERLKKRQRADHKRASERREGALLDEMAIAQHRRAGAAL